MQSKPVTRHPVTVFDRPQWHLLPDPKGARMYANVDNRLQVAWGSRSFAVPLSVSAELFTFLKDVAQALPSDTVTLSMDLWQGFYVFSVFIESSQQDKLYDLWFVKSLPEWMGDRQYHL